MKFCILALNYDGTMAEEGKAHPAVLGAIEGARSRDIRVVLVTWRILSQLRNECNDLGIFDAVAARNGAMLVFPKRMMGRPPPPSGWWTRAVSDAHRTQASAVGKTFPIVNL